MKRFFTPFTFCIGLLLSAPLAHAQSWDWAQVSTPHYAKPVATTTDHSGNVYMLQYVHHRKISVTKMDANGNVLFDKVFPQTNSRRSPVYPESIVTDAEGNIYLSGYFYEGQLSFGSFTLQSNYSEYVDDSAFIPHYLRMCDIFIIKLDSLGHVVWAKNIAGPGRSSSLCVNDQGDLLLSATIKREEQYVGTTLNPFNERAHFVASIDRNTGNISWIRKVGAGEDRGIDTDAMGNIYTLGEMETQRNTSYLVQLNPSSAIEWFKNVNSEAKALATDSAGNSYITGEFFGSVNMANGVHLHTQARWSVMIAKYDANATTLWATAMENNHPNDSFLASEKSANALDVDIDTDGNCYVVGYSSVKVPRGQHYGYPGYGFFWKYSPQGLTEFIKFFRPVSDDLEDPFVDFAHATSISSSPQNKQYLTFNTAHSRNSYYDDLGVELDPGYLVNYSNPSGNSIIAKFDNTRKAPELVKINGVMSCFPCWPWEIWWNFEYRFWNEHLGVEEAIYRRAFEGDHPDEIFWEDEETLMIQLNEENLAPGSYQLQIRALLEDGATTEWTNAVSFTVGTSNARIFPNPVDDVLTVQYQAQQTEEVHLELLNRFGETIQSEIRVAEEGDNEWQLEVLDVRIEDNPLTLLLHSELGTQRWTLLRSR